MIFVLFGPPGVGKTYIGNLLGKKLGIYFYDADKGINDKEEELLRSGRYDQLSRDIFIERLKNKTEKLHNKYKDVIIAEAFTKERNRVDFWDRFGKHVKFVRIVTPKVLAKKRAIKRLEFEEHVITRKLFDFFWKIFDEPKIKYYILDNSKLTDRTIIENFRKLRKEK